MAKIENNHLVLQINHIEGAKLKAIQESLILGIEKIATSETANDEDHKDAVYWLSDLLRESLLDESQTNVGLGNKPYKDAEKDLLRKSG